MGRVSYGVIRPVFNIMKYLRLKSNDPYYNLAVEEYLLRYSEDDIFMLWQNSPSVIVGKNQNIYTEVNTEYVKEKGIFPVRRITGGGAVYHDLGNVNYTFITSRERSDALDFAYFTRPISDALSALGLESSLSGRNDIICGERKISGNAQFSDGNRILHHGTLLVCADLGEMSAALSCDIEKLKARAIRSHKGRVANISDLLPHPISTEEFISHIESQLSHIIEGGDPPALDAEKIDGLACRNRSNEWIFSDKRYLREYTVCKKKRFDFGTVSIELSLNGDTIEKALISGDFFELRPICELEAMLVGLTLSASDLPNPSLFIHGMTAHHIKNLISDD